MAASRTFFITRYLIKLRLFENTLLFEFDNFFYVRSVKSVIFHARHVQDGERKSLANIV